MTEKFSYATQRNTSCNQNAQLWYYVNAYQKMNSSKDPIKKKYYASIVNYYLNGNLSKINILQQYAK